MGEGYIQILIVLIILFVLFLLFKEYRKNQFFNSINYCEVISKIENFNIEINTLKKDFISNSLKVNLLDKYQSVRTRLNNFNLIKKEDNSKIDLFKNFYDNINEHVVKWNNDYVRIEIERLNTFFNDIDGKSLDNEQRIAVVTNEDNTLVIAGAGSGKTLTIAAKVKYLVETRKVQTSEILLLSFTKKAANEMQDRISNRLNIDVEAKTFHKLGYDIVGQTMGFKPNVNTNTELIFNDFFQKEVLSNSHLMGRIVEFFSYYLNIPVNIEKLESLGEMYQAYKGLDLETIKSKIQRLKSEKITIAGERVKSFEEVIIANYLYLNGINYIYEKPYEFQENNPEYKQYLPDFYLVDYDVYLEHFGVNKEFKTPWLTRIEEEKYLSGIHWKRDIHKKNNTTLIETYSYYFSSGCFYEKINELLDKHSIPKNQVNYEVVYKKLFLDETKNNMFKEFVKLTKTFIDLFKSRAFSLDDFDRMNKNALLIKDDFFRERTKLFIEIVKPLYVYYQKHLNQNNQIDFNDMINLASDNLNALNKKTSYKYIIVDEFQDISFSRFRLIQTIRDANKAKVMTVGDDWQSIYRFTGSDIDIFVKPEIYLGYTQILKIQSTYRNSQELIDIARKFITVNPKQIDKELKSKTTITDPLKIVGYGNKFLKALISILEEINQLSNKEITKIMLIGRTNYDINKFKSDDYMSDEEKKLLKDFKLEEKEGARYVSYTPFPKIEMEFITAHGSKGLESDYVIVINMENSILGFPNKIADDPLLNIVLSDGEDCIYAEERRLFYVAITRTKNIAYLMTPQNKISEFVDELVKKFGLVYQIKSDEESIINNPNCPRCKEGYLVLRENKTNGSLFLGCSNFPLCDNTFKQVEILNNSIKCNICGGYMVKRTGTYGEFYGCTNYPTCRNIYKIIDDKIIPSKLIKLV